MVQDYGHVGRDAFQNISDKPSDSIFRAEDSPTLTLETSYSSETTVPMYQTTRRHVQDEHNLHTHRRENLNSHTMTA